MMAFGKERDDSNPATLPGGPTHAYQGFVAAVHSSPEDTPCRMIHSNEPRLLFPPTVVRSDLRKAETPASYKRNPRYIQPDAFWPAPFLIHSSTLFGG